MKTQTPKKSERQYFIDWLRILLIFSVFLFHIGMFFNTWNWHLKNPNLYGGFLENIMIFLSQWRMPVLFMISGAGTFFALGKRSTAQYLKERFRRLFIPFFAGLFILVPVQVYLERTDQYSNLIDYYPYMFEGIYPEGNFSWHHLWFILYLFLISLFISPYLNAFRSERYRRFSLRLSEYAAMPGSLNIILIPLLVSQIFLRPFFPYDTHALIDDWAGISLYIIFFLSGFMLLSQKAIVRSLCHQKNFFLIQGILAAVMMFSSHRLFSDNPENAEKVWLCTSVFLSWSFALAAIGYAAQYLNFNNGFRKIANEAIYPFYLLHQPVILFTGYYLNRITLTDFNRFVLLTLGSLIITCLLYWYGVRPFNLTRIVFGMKTLPGQKLKKEEKNMQSLPRPTGMQA